MFYQQNAENMDMGIEISPPIVCEDDALARSGILCLINELSEDNSNVQSEVSLC